MRRLWRALPHFVRWLLVTALILVVVGGGVWAYTALTASIEVTVEECLSFVGSSTFSVSLYPQESETVSLTIANASSVDMDIDLVSNITPDPRAKGLTVDIPNKITVPASGQVVVDIVMTAGKSVEPGAYSITMEIVR